MDGNRISTAIDDTVAGFLRFLLRYLKTFGRILFFPWRPQRLLNEIDETIVRPLTFLALGSFAIAQLMAVSPNGVLGLFSMIWDAQAIKQEVYDNWTAMLSVTSLVTVGLPVMMCVTGLAAGTAHLMFRHDGLRRRWLEASCYAFGFQAMSIFLTLMVDVLLDSLITVFPPLGQVTIPQPIAGWLTVFALLIGVLIFCAWPFLFLVRTADNLAHHPSAPSRPVTIICALAYVLLQFFAYPAVASILPSLKSRYFSPPEVSVVIEAIRFETFQQNKDQYRFDVELIFTNPTGEDRIIALDAYDWGFVWGASPERSTRNWPLLESALSLTEPRSIAHNWIIPGHSTRISVWTFDAVPLASVFCAGYRLEAEWWDLQSSDKELQSMMLVFDRYGGASYPVSFEDFFAVDFTETEKIASICDTREERDEP